MSTIEPEDYRVEPGKKVDLSKWPTKGKPVYRSPKEYSQILAAHIQKLSERQTLLYASDRYSVLLIFQAMDAAGKDSVIKHVMSGVNPQGVEVYSFKHPSAEDLDHDFLWNAAKKLPERGRIGIFNRSYYEEVLIVRVHERILQAERLPPELVNQRRIWKERYRSIVNLENHLSRNGTVILKFFLHLSKEEQRERFLNRLKDPEKNWKFNAGDMEERKYWKQYMNAYEDCLSATSTRSAPWFIVPADDKQNTRLIVSRIVLDRLKNLRMSYPTPDPEEKRKLDAMLRELD